MEVTGLCGSYIVSEAFNGDVKDVSLQEVWVSSVSWSTEVYFEFLHAVLQRSWFKVYVRLSVAAAQKKMK